MLNSENIFLYKVPAYEIIFAVNRVWPVTSKLLQIDSSIDN